MRLLARIEAEGHAKRRQRFVQIDQALDGGKLGLAELRALKDEMLALIASDRSQSFDAGNRMARINIQLRELAEGSPGRPVAETEDFYRFFYEGARRLLEPSIFQMLCRDAQSGREQNLADRVAKAKEIPLPPPIPRQAEKVPAPMKVPVHRLVSEASSRPMKFDPTPLFKEFGRERVLATWNLCPPESRPETGAEFRRALIASAAQSFLKPKAGKVE